MLDPLSLAVAVAGLIGGLNAAKQLFASLWKRMRKSSKADSDGERLTKLLKSASSEIKKDHEDKRASFGDHFAQGDAISHSQMTQVLIDMNHGLIDVIKNGQAASAKAFTFCTKLVDVVGILRSDCFDCSRNLVHRLQMRTIPTGLDLRDPAKSKPSAANMLATHSTPASDRFHRDTWAPEPRELISCHVQTPKNQISYHAQSPQQQLALYNTQASLDDYDSHFSLPSYSSSTATVDLYEPSQAVPDFHAPDIHLTPIENSARSVKDLERRLFGSSYKRREGSRRFDDAASVGSSSDTVLARNLAALGL